MSFIDSIKAQPEDPIFGLTAEFRADTSDKKINLGVGAYQSNDGQVYEKIIVREVAKELSAKESSKAYLPIGGTVNYCNNVSELLFGSDSPLVKEKRVASVHTPGGTGALRVAAELLFKNTSTTKEVYISDPSWPNHHKIFGKEFGAGFELKKYPYYNYESHSIHFDEMIATLSKAKENSLVLLHLCCHNPTGADLSLEQWEQVITCLKENSLIPIVDCAYQGFSSNTEKDRRPLKILSDQGLVFLAAQSFSKTFSLYGERTGALHVVCNSEKEAKTVRTNLLTIARPIYSNPPSHGGKIVETILSSDENREKWTKELTSVRERINSMRTQLSDMLREKDPKDSLGHIRDGRGMFSITGLNPEQINKLKANFHIYMPQSGRICIAAINSNNIEYVVNSITSVLAD